MNPEIMTEILQQIINNAVTKAQENHHSQIAVDMFYVQCVKMTTWMEYSKE